MTAWTPFWPYAAHQNQHRSQIKDLTASQQLPSDLRPVPLASSLPQHCSKLFWGQLDRPVQRGWSGGCMAVKRQPVDLCCPLLALLTLSINTNTPEGHRHQFSVYLFVLGPQPKHYFICMDGICNDYKYGSFIVNIYPHIFSSSRAKSIYMKTGRCFSHLNRNTPYTAVNIVQCILLSYFKNSKIINYLLFTRQFITFYITP